MKELYNRGIKDFKAIDMVITNEITKKKLPSWDMFLSDKPDIEMGL